MEKIPEKDWKIIRDLNDKLLHRFCESALSKIKNIIDNRGSESHNAYLKIWKTLRKEDKELSIMFDDLKRSNAINKLTAWKSFNLITDSEFNRFSKETKETVEFLNSL